MRPIGGFFYCFSCQPYKETNQACRGSWEHKHFVFPFPFSFFFFFLPLFFVLAFLMFIAIVQRSTLKLMISTCRFVWRTTKSVLQSLYGRLLFTAVSDNTHPRKPRGSQSVLVKKTRRKLPCLKNFVAPFLPARLAAPGSPRINNTWPAPSLEFKFFCDVNQTLKAWHFLADL